jgi:hypothetical protein
MDTKTEKFLAAYEANSCNSEAAMLAAGVDKTWLRRKVLKDAGFVKEVDAIRRLMAEEYLLGCIRNQEARAAMWYLERRDPDKYREKKALEHSGEVHLNISKRIINGPEEKGGGQK